MQSDGNGYRIFEPSFCGKFRCLAGKCPCICCRGWEIKWTADETEQLKSKLPSCTDKLAKLIAESFEPIENSDCFKIKLADEVPHNCPFLTEKKLCAIRSELGKKSLSKVCADYPKSEFFCGGKVIRSCRLSCIGAAKLLAEDEGAMALVQKRGVLKKEYVSGLESAMYPELRYQGLIFDFFYGLVSGTEFTLTHSLIFGLAAAKKLTELIETKNYEHIPLLLDMLAEEYKNGSSAADLSKVKRFYEYKLEVLSKIIERTVNPYIISLICTDGHPDMSKYMTGEMRFRNEYADKPFFLRNIALEMLIECRVPFFSLERSVYDNYCYYFVAFAAVKMIGAAAAYYSGSGKTGDNFMVALSFVSRRLFQNRSNFGHLLDVLTSIQCKSPAALASLLR